MNWEEGRKTERAQRASHSTRMERPGEHAGTMGVREGVTEEGGHVGAQPGPQEGEGHAAQEAEEGGDSEEEPDLEEIGREVTSWLLPGTR